jgi:hypothetical protein
LSLGDSLISVYGFAIARERKGDPAFLRYASAVHTSPTEHKKYKIMNMKEKQNDQESKLLLWGGGVYYS